MHKFLFTSFLVFCISFVQAQPFDWKSHEVKTDADLLKTTIKIFSSPDGFQSGEFGTAYFFLNIPTNELYLVTNAHLVQSFTGCRLWIPRKGQPDNAVTEALLINDLQSFVTIPQQHVDLAYINLSRSKKMMDSLQNFSFALFTSNNLPLPSTWQNLNIAESFIALSFPYPLSVFPQYRGLPFTIPCSLSSPQAFNDSARFFVSGSLTQGCSGSPIVLRKQKSYWLMGTFSFAYDDTRDLLTYSMQTGVPRTVRPAIIDSTENRVQAVYGTRIYIGMGYAIKSTLMH